MTLPDGPLVAWYGDDFTGSAAVMEVLEFAGLKSALFLDIPTPAQLARFKGLRGIGIASTARTHRPEWMEEHLPAPLEFLRDTGAPVVHYKICSTLDSSPEVGSAGKAIDIGTPIIGGAWVPCLLAAPIMRRYQAFGNLFAGAGQGVYRLDRHPVMSRHPVTPMEEADVALHISKQTHRAFGLITIEDLACDPKQALMRAIDTGSEVISLDAMTDAELTQVGGLIWENRGEQLFAVGSQGIEYALVGHWRAESLIPSEDRTTGVGPADRMLAVSGSVSAVTKEQIDWAGTHGFAPIALDAASVVMGSEAAEDQAVRSAHVALSKGLDPLIYSARGPDDPAITATHEARERAGVSKEVANARIGAALGRCLSRLIRETGIRRAVISGGDTSGHASRELGLYAFTALAPTIPAAALLAAHTEDPALAGLQLALKGGQMGSADYFGWIKRGGGAA